jgi:hypothetical protein
VSSHTRLIHLQTSQVLIGVQMVKIPNLVVLTSDLGRMKATSGSCLRSSFKHLLSNMVFIHLHLVYKLILMCTLS